VTLLSSAIYPLNSAKLPRIRSRQIEQSDVPTVAALLTRGFRSRPARFWSELFNCLADREAPPELPKYGYLLETDGGAVVGAILLIFSARPDHEAGTRCNVSSWFVEPAFRSYASLLVSKALRHRSVTYVNITPAPHTLPILRAHGYVQYSKGVFVTLPAARFGSRGTRVVAVNASSGPSAALDEFESRLLLDHARYGCISLLCRDLDQTYPFVFRPRAYKSIPCAQLVYCRDLDQFVRFAGALGRFLTFHGRALVVLDSNGPIPGLIGKFFDGRMPKYFKGPARPRLGDLAYTEAAIFGM
jgi:hypothetical protein